MNKNGLKIFIYFLTPHLSVRDGWTGFVMFKVTDYLMIWTCFYTQIYFHQGLV